MNEKSLKHGLEGLEDFTEKGKHRLAGLQDCTDINNTRKSVPSAPSQKSVVQTMNRYLAYKDSGVEWLGEVPEHWDVISLGSLIEPKSVKNKPKLQVLSVYRDYGVIPKDSREDNHNATSLDTSNYKAVKPGDLVVNKMKAWQGSMGISAHEGIVSPAYITCKITSEKVMSPYIHQLLRCNSYIGEYNRISYGVRVGQCDMHYEDFKKVPVLLPPPQEQTRIAHFLDRKTAQIDKAIAQKERLIELLKERRQVMIHQAVTRGLNPDVPMKDSGVEWIGKIPAHWEVKRLKTILKSQGRIGFKGYTTSDLVDEGEGALTLGASHMDWDGNILTDEPVFISWKKYYESPEIMVRKGDILIVQRGSTCGKVALVSRDLGPTTINPSLVLLKEIKEYPNYIFLGIKVVLSGILNIVNNTAIPMLSQFQIDNIFITVPPHSEQVAIDSHINIQSEKIDRVIASQQIQIEKIKEYKTTLINSAVTGKIKV